jgi:mannobiose 2-epimerase
MRAELRDNLLPFWLRLEDPLHGGHYAWMDPAGRVDRSAPKSTVFVSRLLWTLSAAAGALERDVCLAQAAHTRRFLLDRLCDPKDGAFFWSASREGRPLETDKHLYAQAFAIYALSAHARATGDEESLAAAMNLFGLIEARAGEYAAGYGEAFDSRWRPIENSRMGCSGVGTRTANSHLHLIEAYAGLVRASPHPAPRAALKELLRLFVERFLAGDGTHSHSYLDRRLRPLPGPTSYGHDIEASWLLVEAADTLAEADFTARLVAVASSLARAAAAGGQCSDGGWITERTFHGAPDTYRVWWTQAEAVVGLVNAAVLDDDPQMMAQAEATWAFIDRTLIDRVGGEWYHGVDQQGRPDPKQAKVGPWKEPYHQARACLEIMRRAAEA